MSALDRAAAAEDRSLFYWWLAEWFLNPPNQDSLASLPSTIDAAPQADPLDEFWRALAEAAAGLSTTPPDEIGSEFTRLMSGIQEGLGPPPPFESVWREDRLIGESTVAVIETYAEAGFADIQPEVGPQDHLAVELKFLALLALREAEAWRAGDLAGALQRIAQQRDFLREHLAAWAPRWADAIIHQSRVPLYSALAGLLKASLDQAACDLAELAALAA